MCFSVSLSQQIQDPNRWRFTCRSEAVTCVVARCVPQKSREEEVFFMKFQTLYIITLFFLQLRELGI